MDSFFSPRTHMGDEVLCTGKLKQRYLLRSTEYSKEILRCKTTPLQPPIRNQTRANKTDKDRTLTGNKVQVDNDGPVFGGIRREHRQPPMDHFVR